MRNIKNIKKAAGWQLHCVWLVVSCWVVGWVWVLSERVAVGWVCRYRVLSLRWFVYWWCERQWSRCLPVLLSVYEWVLILGVLAFVVYGLLAQWFGWAAPVPVRPAPYW